MTSERDQMKAEQIIHALRVNPTGTLNRMVGLLAGFFVWGAGTGALITWAVSR